VKKAQQPQKKKERELKKGSKRERKEKVGERKEELRKLERTRLEKTGKHSRKEIGGGARKRWARKRDGNNGIVKSSWKINLFFTH